jgi:hypothetical protein
MQCVSAVSSCSMADVMGALLEIKDTVCINRFTVKAFNFGHTLSTSMRLWIT